MQNPILQVVFDCDGVLLESTNIKTLAFEKVVSPFGEEAQKCFINYHNKHFGISRMAKFEWFCREVLQNNNTDMPKELANNFANIVQEELLNCPMVEGTLKTLKTLHNKMPLYVCSGTPQEELISILTKRGLAKYFKGVFGTPPEKAELLKTLVKKSGIASINTLMVGDAQTDLDVANSVATQFYGIGEYFKEMDVKYANDLNGLLKFVKSNNIIK